MQHTPKKLLLTCRIHEPLNTQKSEIFIPILPCSLPVLGLDFVLQFLHKIPCSKHQLEAYLASFKTPQTIAEIPPPLLPINPRLQSKKMGFGLENFGSCSHTQIRIFPTPILGFELFFFLFLLQISCSNFPREI